MHTLCLLNNAHLTIAVDYILLLQVANALIPHTVYVYIIQIRHTISTYLFPFSVCMYEATSACIQCTLGCTLLIYLSYIQDSRLYPRHGHFLTHFIDGTCTDNNFHYSKEVFCQIRTSYLYVVWWTRLPQHWVFCITSTLVMQCTQCCGRYVVWFTRLRTQVSLVRM